MPDITVILELTSEQFKLYKKNPDSLRGVVRSVTGEIASHINVKKKVSKVAKIAGKTGKSLMKSKNLINSATGAVTCVSEIAQNVQLHKIDKRTKLIEGIVTKMSGKMDIISNLTVLNAGLSVMNIGVTLVSTAIITKRMNEINNQLMDVEKSIERLFKEISKIEGHIRNEIAEDYEKYIQTLIIIIDSINIDDFDATKLEKWEYDLIDVYAFLDRFYKDIEIGLIEPSFGYSLFINMLIYFMFACIKFYLVYFLNKHRAPSNWDTWKQIGNKFEELIEYYKQYYLKEAGEQISFNDICNLLNEYRQMGEEFHNNMNAIEDTCACNYFKCIEDYSSFVRRIEYEES